MGGQCLASLRAVAQLGHIVRALGKFVPVAARPPEQVTGTLTGALGGAAESASPRLLGYHRHRLESPQQVVEFFDGRRFQFRGPFVKDDECGDEAAVFRYPVSRQRFQYQ